MSTTTEEATTGIEERITHSTYPESTETEVEKSLGTRDDTETATRIEHHTNRDGQNTTTRAAVAVNVTKRRRAVVDRIIEVEKHKGHTQAHRLGHARDLLDIRPTADATDHVRLDPHHAALETQKRSDGAQRPATLTLTPLKPSSALFHLQPNPLSVRVVGAHSRPTL
jgi:hypothetical protein